MIDNENPKIYVNELPKDFSSWTELYQKWEKEFSPKQDIFKVVVITDPSIADYMTGKCLRKQFFYEIEVEFMKNKVLEESKNHLPYFEPLPCNNDQPIERILLVDKKLFINENFFGNVIDSYGSTLKVQCKNGNKYMQDEIYTLTVMNQDAQTDKK